MAKNSEFRETHIQAYVEWKIEEFSKLPKDKCCTSPNFSMSHSKWCLWISPNEGVHYNSAGWIVLYLKKDEFDEECCVAYKIGIKKEDGSELATHDFKFTFRMGNVVGCPYLIERYPLIRTTSTEGMFASDGSVTFFCSARIENTKEEQTQTVSPYVIPTLIEDLKCLHPDRENTDVIIKVKNNYLVAHKYILAARSNVFAAMLMVENGSRVVEVNDSDLETFKDFILHLYTGRLDMVSSNNALSLYKTAHKYNVTELKKECVQCLMQEISMDSFYDIVYLAILYCESDLLTAANTFFYRNQKILHTSKWNVFSSENPIICQKLFSEFYKIHDRELALLYASVKYG